MIEVTATHLASPLAWGTAAHLAALRDGQTALRHDHYFGLPEPTTAAVFHTKPSPSDSPPPLGQKPPTRSPDLSN